VERIERERDTLRSELERLSEVVEARTEWLERFRSERDAWKARAETAEQKAVELAGRFAGLSRLTAYKRDAKTGRFV